MIHLSQGLNFSLGLIPLLHSERLTWDEFLVLGLGIALIMLVGWLGRRSDRGEIGRSQPGLDRLAHQPVNGQVTPQRRSLAIKTISHRYGTGWVLTKLSLDIPAGQCVSILGPNGAGKSTLLNILATLVEPVAGDVVIGNASLQTNPVAMRRYVGLVSHKPLLYPHLTVLENLHLFGQLYDVADKEQQADRLLQQVQLWPKRNQLVHALSHGQRQRTAIARALMHRPDIVLLDEPYTGLDMRAAEQLDALLDDLLAEGHTLLITTHDLRRSLARSGRIIILAGGRIIYQADSDDLTLEKLQSIYRQTFKLATD